VRIATRFKSIDPDVHDEVGLFHFEPLQDITPYELAVITQKTSSNEYDIDWLANAPTGVFRHFKRAKV